MPVLNLGIPNAQYPQDMLDKFSGRLVIVGGGRCVWDDLRQLGFHHDCLPQTDIMCINDIVMHFPGKVKHFFSNDSNWTPHWLKARRHLLERAYGPIEYVHTCHTGARYNWPWPGHGTSALGAVYSALAMGYNPIVLCGIPLDDSGHYFEAPWIDSNFTKEIGFKGTGKVKYWSEARDKIFQGKVTSMSGRTKVLLDETIAA